MFRTIILFLIITTFSLASLEDECLTTSKFEEDYPEYSSYTLRQRFEPSGEKVIGRGSFGAVIKGKLNNEEIVIKEVSTLNPEEVNLIKTEIQILKKIQNQHYLLNFHLCVFDRQTKKAYIFTEILSKDLENDEIFKKKPQFEKLKFYKELAKALKQLHSLGYVHNDIKPANIMLKDKTYKNPKLIDFGLSTLKGEITVGGSPIYMPLEKLDKQLNSEFEMDIVSYGVTIAALEIGQEKVIETIQNQWGFFLSSIWSSFHGELSRLVGEKYPIYLENPNFFVRAWKWFIGIFENNTFERIYSFEDFLNALMDNRSERRLTLDQAVLLLDRFIVLYDVETKDLQESNRDVEEIDLGLVQAKDLKFLADTQSIGKSENFGDVILEKHSKIMDQSMVKKVIIL